MSVKLYCRVAAMIPNEIPNSDARKWQVSASAIVAGRRSATTSETGLLQKYECPKSPPVRMPPIQRKYCTTIGSFRPCRSRNAAAAASAAVTEALPWVIIVERM